MGSQSPFRDILFPIDFSKSCLAIADHVAGLAKAARAKVWLLNVVPRLEEWHGVSELYFGPLSTSAIAIFEKERRALEANSRKMLQEFQEKHLVGVESEIAVTTGGVAVAITDFAREKNIGLIMIPTRAQGRHRQFLLGSVTSKVLHDAPCAVWTSPHPHELNPFRPYRRIVLALDYRSLSTRLLVRASEFAELFGATLTVFSAIPRAPQTSHHFIDELKAELIASLKKDIGECKVKASIRLMEGNPGEVIAQVAEDMEQADLIITGRGRLDEAAGHVRSHSYEIIWNAPCPVITL